MKKPTKTFCGKVIVKSQGKPYPELLEDVKTNVDVNSLRVEVNKRKNGKGVLMIEVEEQQNGREILRNEIKNFHTYKS